MKLLKKRQLLVIACCLILTACKPQLKKSSALQFELSPLKAVGTWSLRGKMALSDGQQGGSGQVIWKQSRQQIFAQLKAPLGQGRWSIVEQQDGAAVLSSSKRGVIRSNDAGLLLQREVGWEIPWTALKSWLKIEPFDSNQAQIMRQGEHLIIQEMGWRIEYKNWYSTAKTNLPRRISAKKGPFSIKLSIKQWDVPIE